MNKPTSLTLPAITIGSLRLPALDVRDFASRLSSFYSFQRRTRRRRAKEALLQRHKNRWFRKHRPQNLATIERADTNLANRERGLLYLTLSNGQVLRADRTVTRPGYNPMLRDLVGRFIDSQETPALP